MQVLTLFGTSVVLLVSLYDVHSLKLHFLDKIHKAVENVKAQSPLGILKNVGLPRPADGPAVDIANGKIQGVIEVSRQGYKYYAYYGIPYAKPPVAERRFQPPAPLDDSDNWKETLNTTVYKRPCMQMDAVIAGDIYGLEDCLYLNVFTPKLNPKKPYSVMVWIHGGLFTAGSPEIFNPKFFIDNNVVFVSMAYRVGALGFLNTGDKEVTGNMGLKDQNVALKWVKKNIDKFGGNPDDVTLFGQGSGAVCVHHHVLSPLSAGLFQRAIAQSGTILTPFGFTRNPAHQAKKFAKKFDCKKEDTKEMVDCLMKIEPEELVKVHKEISNPIHKQDELFTPSIEVADAPMAFITESPFTLLESGKFSAVPMIFGNVAADGAYKTARLERYDEFMKTLVISWNVYTPIFLHYSEELTNVSKTLKKRYLTKQIDNVGITDLTPVMKMLSDGLFFHPNMKAANLHKKKAPTRLYHYTYKGKNSAYPAMRSYKPGTVNFGKVSVAATYAQSFVRNNIISIGEEDAYTKWGPVHGDDLFCLFAADGLTEVNKLHADYEFSYNLAKTWARFAKASSSLKFDETEWPATDGETPLKALILDRDPSYEDVPYKEAVDFFESLKIRDGQLEVNY